MYQSLQLPGFPVSPPAGEPTSAERQSATSAASAGATRGLLSEGLEPDFFFPLSDVSALNNSSRINIAGSQWYQVIGKGVLWPLG